MVINKPEERKGMNEGSNEECVLSDEEGEDRGGRQNRETDQQ